MRESCDKNVIMPLRGEMAGWEKAKPEASRAGIFPNATMYREAGALSDVGLVKGEILALQYQKLTFNHKDAELFSCVTVLKIRIASYTVAANNSRTNDLILQVQ